jgi:hypothetical protein
MLLRHARLSSRGWLWLTVSLALVAAGIVLIVVSLNGPKSAPNLPGPIGRTSAPAPRTSTPKAAPVILDSYSTSSATGTTTRLSSHLTAIKSSRPVHIRIPSIHVNASVVELGLNANGTVQVPSSWTTTGWYKYGPTPGQKGSAVILGHVDSVTGPAVFYDLSLLRPGNLIDVTLASGVTVHFSVIGLREYEKTQLPGNLVYGPRSYDALQLVTCGGQFDSKTHHYLSNIVVFSKRVA